MEKEPPPPTRWEDVFPDNKIDMLASLSDVELAAFPRYRGAIVEDEDEGTNMAVEELFRTRCNYAFRNLLTNQPLNLYTTMRQSMEVKGGDINRHRMFRMLYLYCSQEVRKQIVVALALIGIDNPRAYLSGLPPPPQGRVPVSVTVRRAKPGARFLRLPSGRHIALDTNITTPANPVHLEVLDPAVAFHWKLENAMAMRCRTRDYERHTDGKAVRMWPRPLPLFSIHLNTVGTLGEIMRMAPGDHCICLRWQQFTVMQVLYRKGEDDTFGGHPLSHYVNTARDLYDVIANGDVLVHRRLSQCMLTLDWKRLQPPHHTKARMNINYYVGNVLYAADTQGHHGQMFAFVAPPGANLAEEDAASRLASTIPPAERAADDAVNPAGVKPVQNYLKERTRGQRDPDEGPRPARNWVGHSVSVVMFRPRLVHLDACTQVARQLFRSHLAMQWFLQDWPTIRRMQTPPPPNAPSTDTAYGPEDATRVIASILAPYAIITDPDGRPIIMHLRRRDPSALARDEDPNDSQDEDRE